MPIKAVDIVTGLTRREKIVLTVAGVLSPFIFIVPQHIINDYEMVWLLLVVLPLGILIATDPERIGSK